LSQVLQIALNPFGFAKWRPAAGVELSPAGNALPLPLQPAASSVCRMKDPRTVDWSRDRDLWDRPSLDMNVRPNKVVRNIGRPDLLIPMGPSKPKMLVVTCFLGIVIAMLYVFPVLLIVAILASDGLSATWVWATLSAASIFFWVALFASAVNESAADRRYAEKLYG
jgi:hypothetical protein